VISRRFIGALSTKGKVLQRVSTLLKICGESVTSVTVSTHVLVVA
jgi:hypothetical protein